MDDWRAAWAARVTALERWTGHVVDSVNGHLVWRLTSDERPGACRVFYDGDYSEVLAPDDPRILVPRVAEVYTPPLSLDWSEMEPTSSD